MAGSLVTTEGKKIFLDRTYNLTPTRTPVSQFKIGQGTTDPVVGDTAMENVVPISFTLVDNCGVADWTDNADCTTSLQESVYKTGSASLNVTKDGTASADAETYKTTPSLNFTSHDLNLWIYIVDAPALAKLAVTNAATIRFGSDSSNYYEWRLDNADLAVGWNRITGLNSGNADTTTGTPTITACDYAYLKFTATGAAITWSDGDILMDDWKIVDTADFTKDFEAGYPALDFTNLEAHVRGRINTLEGNGYNISEFGVFNTDGTPVLESRDTFTPISKSNTDEIIFVAKVLIE